VLVLEKHSLPRYKPCAGGVSPAIAEWFDFDFSPVIARKVDTIGYTWKLEDPVQAKLEALDPMWMVHRDVFDHFLVQQAQKQGAEVKDGTAVTGIEYKGDRWQVNTSNDPVEGRYLIAADGAEGPMSQWLGFKQPKRRLGAILEAVAPEAEHLDAKFEFGMVKNGYLSSFPKENGCSIAVATFRGGEPGDLQAVLTDYASKTGIPVSACQSFTHSLCLWDGNHKLHTQNALLAGEAASIVDPLIAEGVRPAIFTGVKAAAAIDAALAGSSSALEDYTKIVSEEWGADMAWAHRIAGAFYRFPGLGYKQGIKRPRATVYFGRILCGQMRYSDIANTAIKRKIGGLIQVMG
jgi:geranylgeranyl reductase family protein